MKKKHTHDPDRALLDRLAEARQSLAHLLAHLGEIDARKLYLTAGCTSMQAYCVQVFHFDEDDAEEHVCAARTARRFPAIFHAIADGRLNLGAVALLAPHLTDENAAALLASATHRSNAEIKLILAMHGAPT